MSRVDPLYHAVFDCMVMFEREMDEKNITLYDLADRMGVNSSIVSFLFSDKGKTSLEMVFSIANALGMQVSLVAHESSGKPTPILPDVFYETWKRCNKPRNFFDLGMADK